MVKTLASRVAGLRLTAIVFVLLVPILLLSHLTLNNLRREISLREDEAEGVLLANIVMPVAIGIADGSLTGEKAAAQLAGGKTLPPNSA